MESDQSEYDIPIDESLKQLETLKWKYDLSPEVQNRIDDIVDLGQSYRNRDQTAERVGDLIGYIADRHPDHEYKDQIRQYLNDVMTDLYGNN